MTKLMASIVLQLCCSIVRHGHLMVNEVNPEWSSPRSRAGQ